MTPMEHDLASFLQQHRDELLTQWENRARERLRSEDPLTTEQLRNSFPIFFDEIVDALARRDGRLYAEQRSALARVHGAQRQHLGSNIAELLREYGLLFECVLDLAEQRGAPVGATALRALSACLYTGAAEAVEEFEERARSSQRQVELEHFSFIAHEVRNPLWSARLSWDAVRRTHALAGRSIEVLTRSLSRMAELIDATLSAARLASLGSAPQLEREAVDVAALVESARFDSSGDAELRHIALSVEPVSDFTVTADPRLLLSALTNVVRNAIKYTSAGGSVSIRCREEDGRLLIEVEDQCGGLPPERAERLFQVFTQAHADRTGFGLGLPIAKQAVEAHGGTIGVKNVPGCGCIFVLDLPGPEPLSGRAPSAD